jgi:four helix bundle protein
MPFAIASAVGVQRLEDLSAYQLATELKAEVYRLADSSDRVRLDDRYRLQLFDASASVAANIAEGWARFSAAEFCQFLRYARASLTESQTWLHDGVARGYFTSSEAVPALRLASRCGAATTALWRSLQPFIKKR